MGRGSIAFSLTKPPIPAPSRRSSQRSFLILSRFDYYLAAERDDKFKEEESARRRTAREPPRGAVPAACRRRLTYPRPSRTFAPLGTSASRANRTPLQHRMKSSLLLAACALFGILGTAQAGPKVLLK